jgi:hypothetical protein
VTPSSPFTPVLAAVFACFAGWAVQNDLDAFMAKVLARREVNRQTLNDYILSEVETFELLAPGRVPLYRFRREFGWYVREGTHVRSPVRYDGVTIDEAARRKYEADWFRREQERQKKEAEKKAKEGKAPVPAAPEAGQGSMMGQVIEPRFVSEAYFLDFKFEPGNYYLVGREALDGHDVMRVEYYPTGMFSDEDELQIGAEPAERETRPHARRREPTPREKELEAEIDRKMNKTSLVTLWIDPEEHQIVKYTFDNVWLDFLPARWLVRVDDIKASMTMGQPFEGVWLPKAIGIHAGVTLANGSYEAAYTRQFSDYRQADVKSKIRVKSPEAR